MRKSPRALPGGAVREPYTARMSNKRRAHRGFDRMHDSRPFLDPALLPYDTTKPCVVLDRIEPDVPADELPYCTHGRVTCVWCKEWCWLGHATHDAVRKREANPICKQCAVKIYPADAAPVARIQDHLRADGPHE